jgi:hypothetical protein
MTFFGDWRLFTGCFESGGEQAVKSFKRRSRIMKKRVCYGGIVLIFVAVLSASWLCIPSRVDCASRPEVMTPKDAPALKGKWVGRTQFGSFGSAEAGGDTVTELEITNDTLPLEGKITFLVLPRDVWKDLPSGIQGGPTGQGAVVLFKKGRLSDKGAFMLISGDNSLTLYLYNEGGKQKLVGSIHLVSSGDNIFFQGDVSLDKK